MVSVLHVSEVSWGGVVSLLRQFASHQTGHGDRVSLLASAGFPNLPGVRQEQWSLERGRVASYPRAIRELRESVAHVKPDVLHVHSFMAGFFTRLPLVSGVSNVPMVYQPHAWSFELYEDARVQWLIKAWERAANGRTDVLVANCQDEIDEGVRAGIRKDSRALGVTVDLDFFVPPSPNEQSSERKRLGVADRRVVLCLGRLVRQKGQDMLVKAWEADPIPEATLVLAGPGDPAPLRALAPNEWGRSIQAVGELTDVRPWLAAADLLALPSRYETVAVVVAEALACGVPVIATAVSGTGEAIVDGPLPRAGAVVTRDDMGELLRECRRRFEEPELMKVERQVARGRAETLFAADAIGPRLDAAYDLAIKIKKRAGDT